MRIDCIRFKGEVRRADYTTLESDEYVQITNHGDAAQHLEGWVLKDRDDRHQDYTFASY